MSPTNNNSLPGFLTEVMNTRENSMPLSLDILPLSNILKYSHNVPQDLILSHNMYIKTIIWGFIKRLAHFINIIFTFSLLWQTTKLLWMRLLQRQFCLLLNVIQCMLLFKTFLGVTHVLLSVRFLDSLSLCLSVSLSPLGYFHVILFIPLFMLVFPL